MRVSKLSQNLIFWVNYALKLSLSLSVCVCVCVCVVVCVCVCVCVCMLVVWVLWVFEFVRWFFQWKSKESWHGKVCFICVFLIIVNQAYLHFCLRSKVILTAKPWLSLSQLELCADINLSCLFSAVCFGWACTLWKIFVSLCLILEHPGDLQHM